MKIVDTTISMDELRKMANDLFGDLVKAVVDVDRELLAVDAELHSDLEALLLENGSEQRNLWGINLYPENPPDGLIEFDSVINLRPSRGNMTRSVNDETARAQIISIVKKRVVQ